MNNDYIRFGHHYINKCRILRMKETGKQTLSLYIGAYGGFKGYWPEYTPPH